MPTTRSGCASSWRRAVPNHFAGVTASVNQGVPIGRMSRGNPVSRALLDLAQRISPAEKSKKDSWLSTIFGNA